MAGLSKPMHSCFVSVCTYVRKVKETFLAGYVGQCVCMCINFSYPSIMLVYPCMLVGHGIPTLLKAVLKLLPLDQYVPKPVSGCDFLAADVPLCMTLCVCHNSSLNNCL